MTRALDTHLARTLAAALWAYGARSIGLLWTLLLIGQLGIGEYGQYAMAYALAALVTAPLEHPFTVRGVREDEPTFLGERSTRVLLGLVLLATGLATTSITYVVWFGLVVAGAELAFNAVKAQAFRDGHPQRVQRLDSTRQVASVAAGTAYLLLAPEPTLVGASVCYLLPYVVPVALAVALLRTARPRLPRPVREVALLVTEELGTSLYGQADVLLLGALAGDTVAGYYAICWMVTLTVASVGQAFGATYHEKLRAAGSAADAGPPLRTTALVSLVAGALVLGLGLVLFLLPVPTEVAATMTVMSGFAALRTAVWVLTTVLFFQRRDAVRVWAAVALVPLKAALLLVLCGPLGLGAVGAAAAAVVTDLTLVLVYVRAVHSRRAPVPSVGTPT